MRRTLPILITTVALLSCGIVQGIWTGRWITSHSLEEAATRLDRVPMTIGDWKGRPLEFDAQQYARAGIVGGIERIYEDRRNGATVTLLIVCGPPGPISVHTPDICFPSAGYEILRGPTETSVAYGDGAQSAGFQRLDLVKPLAITPELLSVHYAWNAEGDWQAPDLDPRLTFAGFPFLYKLYVVRVDATAEGETDDAPSLKFLRDAIPELRRALFPAPP